MEISLKIKTAKENVARAEDNLQKANEPEAVLTAMNNLTHYRRQLKKLVDLEAYGEV